MKLNNKQAKQKTQKEGGKTATAIFFSRNNNGQIDKKNGAMRKGIEKVIGSECRSRSICSELLLDLFQSRGIKRWQPTPEKPAAKTSQVAWI